MRQKWKLFILRKKIDKKEQILIDDDEKREYASVESSLIKKSTYKK